ncbi:MAG: iron-containing alcohol dehydrogenase [Acidiferrobacterales bacterium]|nr:iron-containing alcohol dehydrogenase [Acidiferrobacterales bacterium]
MNINWNYPTAMRNGEGRVNEIAAICKEFGMTTPLLVTDPGLAALDMTKNILACCKKEGIHAALFSDIKPNPTGTNVESGIQAYLEGKHDGVIALGGGSGLDAGKAIAVAANQTCSLWDLEDVGDNWLNADPEKIPPIVAIPTTAGTGSEVGRASVIVNEAEEKKAIIFHPKMLPGCVILDAELTTGLPASLTAATGMDALSHSLEAFCSPVYHPMAEGIAIEGIRLVKEYLPTAVKEGSNIEARRQMLVASTMGATAFQRGLGAMHALAHPLGAIYDAHHGMLNAILMPYVLVANRSAIEPQIERLARYLSLPSDFDHFLQWVLDLREEIGIHENLSMIGINEERVGELGEMAVADPSASTNPILHSANDYSQIVTNAIRGEFG